MALLWAKSKQSGKIAGSACSVRVLGSQYAFPGRDDFLQKRYSLVRLPCRGQIASQHVSCAQCVRIIVA
jgi:hypothetical protein